MRTKYLFIIGLLFGCLNALAQQATFGSVVVYQSVASNLAAPLVLDVRGQKNVTIQWTIKHSGTATTLEGIQIRDSVDGTTASGRIQNLLITPSSATTKSAYGNYVVAGYPYMLITYITNNDADTYSTNTIKYWIKKNAP